MESVPVTSIDSHSASALHKRLRDATHAALVEEAKPEVEARPATTVGVARARRRQSAAASWSLLNWMHVAPDCAPRSSAEQEHAVRLVLCGLLKSGVENDVPFSFEGMEEGPVLIVRSGPWPLLRTLLDALAEQPQARPISVLCHARDTDGLAQLAEATGLELTPIIYPRFELFETAILRRALADGVWTTAFVLDTSKHGRGWSLEHVTSALDAAAICVWNGSNTAFRLRSLRERLGRQKYAAVRCVLRWHASKTGEYA
jgi:hypothetical protein